MNDNDTISMNDLKNPNLQLDQGAKGAYNVQLHIATDAINAAIEKGYITTEQARQYAGRFTNAQNTSEVIQTISAMTREIDGVDSLIDLVDQQRQDVIRSSESQGMPGILENGYIRAKFGLDAGGGKTYAEQVRQALDEARQEKNEGPIR